ncbi:MAG: carboxylesterase/lipase family protein [bacterium]
MSRFSGTVMVLVAAFGLAACSSDSVSDDSPSARIQAGLEIEIDSGLLLGVREDDVRVFKGIPYAAAPVGELRWKGPQAPEPWSGLRDATEFGLICPQDDPLGMMRGAPQSEDCLFLNVFSPGESPEEALPVMVWIHGGAWITGAGSQDFYQAHTIVNEGGVVVVSLNYRLGVFGYLAHGALSAESEHGASGNYGQWDQVAALEWVHHHIRAFGGDPDNVTIFGESAGGNGVCTLMASPLAGGLFHRAISQSGLCGAPGFDATLAAGEANGEQFSDSVGCSDTAAAASCLRGKTTEEIRAIPTLEGNLRAWPGGAFYPPAPSEFYFNARIVDGYVLSQGVAEAFAAGDIADVPFLLGVNGDEGTLFHSPLLATPVADEMEYRAALGRTFPDDVDAILAEYPVADFASASAALTEVSADAFFVCPTRTVARSAARAGLPTFLYAFEFVPAALLPGLGSFHTAEIPFVFGVDAFALVTEDARPLHDAMLRYWTRFAAAGDPNGESADTWPAFDNASEEFMVLDSPLAIGTGYRQERCDFWDSIL